jgi:hypothetical protein
MEYLTFNTEQDALNAESTISQGLGLPSEKGTRWDTPEVRAFSSGEKWSVIPCPEVEIENAVKESVVEESYQTVLDFENWEKRFDAVAQCKTLVNESPITIPDGQGGTLPLRAIIQEWYTGAMTEVNDFIKTGSGDFLRLIEEGDEFWWNLVSSEEAGSVRTQATNLIKPLVV